jgi:dTDP-4-dehydrorhamnose 3,5-epimerase-like enzyme
MRHYNIYSNNEPGLGTHADDRGIISDVFYKANMHHACVITNVAGAVRGNHYHKFTTQYTLVIGGTLHYYFKPVDGTANTECYIAQLGDFIISEPNEIHAMQAGDNGCVFIAFAQGPRGGEDYESDTVRVDNIIFT